MELQHESNVVYRCIARENKEVNKHWICDEGRFNYHYTQESDRVTEPAVQRNGELQMSSWGDTVLHARKLIEGKKVVVLVGSDLTQEELKLIQLFVSQKLSGSPVFHFGTPGVLTSQEDDAADALLKRKSKTANLHGAEKLGLSPLVKLPAGTEAVLVFRGGRAQLPAVSGVSAVGIGVFKKSDLSGYGAILPGAAFTEKEGTIVNFLGMEQKFSRAIVPPRGCKTVSETLMMWTNL